MSRKLFFQIVLLIIIAAVVMSAMKCLCHKMKGGKGCMLMGKPPCESIKK